MDHRTEIEAVRKIGQAIGYGNLMSIASALWMQELMDDGMDAQAAGNAAFVPTCLPFIKQEYQPIAKQSRSKEMSWLANGQED